MRPAGQKLAPGVAVVTRQRRDQRRVGTDIVLTNRDRLLLAALERFRLARTGDLIRVGFPGVRRDTAIRRLRRLFDAGYLDVHSGDRSQESIYSLGPAARRLQVGESVRRLPKQPWGHHLAIVAVWSRLAHTAHVGGRFGIGKFRPEWVLRELAVGSPFIPDAVVDLIRADTQAPLRIAIEVDLGGESLRVIRQKLQRYREELTLGGDLLGGDFALAVVIGNAGDGRLANIRRLLEAGWPGVWAAWHVEDDSLEPIQRLLGRGLGLPSRPPLAARGEEGA
jgi:hypothetical protein